MKYEPIDIKCPDCGGLAKFEEPFEFHSKREASLDESRTLHRWGVWFVLERFPSLVKWKAPSGSNQYLRNGGDNGKDGYPLLTNGLIQCPRCHSNRKHKLAWPNDAFWQWPIRGELLWAWDKDHAQTILNFVKKTDRPPRYHDQLKYIPSRFLSGKVRDLVVKKMEQSIDA